MYKNIKNKISKRQKKRNKRDFRYYRHTYTKKITIVVLSSSIKKIEMLKQNSYVFTNGIHKKRQIMFN